MSDPNGWPDPARPGVPLNPEQDGAHVLLWRKDAPQQAWWRSGKQEWRWPGGDKCGDYTAGINAAYLGPCLTPQEVAAREAAAEARGREAGLREAAAEVDCGCAARQDVLARFATDGHKRASYLCPHGDACCALAAAAILARIEEAPHD